MDQLTIGNRSLAVPILVPSVSSFETLLRPAAALRLQNVLAEPISLVSAYDIAQDEPELTQACVDFRKNGVLLLDSGGYESSRIDRYLRTSTWNFETFQRIAAKGLHDFVFSYDYFPKHGESAQEFVTRILMEFQSYSSFLELNTLIPVIHITSVDGKFRLSDQDAIDIFGLAVAEMGCRLIAIPERELGNGIISRAELAQKIVLAIRGASKPCGLHVLGCGNPLSFSILAVAGILMSDGLEWCRTYAAENFHLHHTQQQELFPHATPISQPVAELFLYGNLSYPVAVAARNLVTFQAFSGELQKGLVNRTVHEMIRSHFGNAAANAVRAIET